MDYIKSVQRFTGEKRWTREGVIIGFLAGMSVTLVRGFTWEEDGAFGGKGAALFLGTIIYGSAGVGLGAAVGSLIRTERWEDISITRIRSNRLPHNLYGVKIRFSLPLGKAAR